MRSLITKRMTKMTKDNVERCEAHERKVGHSQEVIDSVILTCGIAMVVSRIRSREGKEIVTAFAYYPRTGCEDYVSMIEDGESVEEFTERSIDALLAKHNWMNPEVKKLIESRRGEER